MDSKKSEFQNMEEYIKTFPADIQKILQEIRKVIHETAPDAAEKISYQMPCFYLYGNLVYFAAFKKHIGFYPAPGGISAFADELEKYVHAKGSVQFPLDEPIPFDLIKKIVKYRVEENIKKAAKKKKK